MKNLLFLIAIISLSISSFSQITLEHAYDADNIHLFQVDENEYNYVIKDFENKQVRIYDLNHSLITIINLAMPEGDNWWIHFVSKKLFDLDDQYEVIYTHGTPGSGYTIKIINEESNILFEEYGTNEVYLYSTPSGSKMILKIHADEIAKVYSLQGIYYGEPTINEGVNFLPYPNPSNNTIRLPYELPNGYKEGLLSIYNSEGKMIEQFRIDNNFNDVFLRTTPYPTGIYFYSIISNKYKSKPQKFIISR